MQTINCNICGSGKHKILFAGRDRLHRVDDKLFNIVKCLECKLVFINPQPTVKELEKYYPPQYGPYQDGNEIFKYGLVSRLLKKAYPGSLKSDDPEQKPAPNEPPINYLDFGCGSGAILERIGDRHPSWNLYGLDNNEYACQKVREKGFTVFCGDVLTLDMPKDFFDIVNMSHVIEHLIDPRKTLLKINETMKFGANIIISTPNFNSLASQIFRTYWYALEAPRHLYLFTPDSLERILEETGFIVEKIDFDDGPKTGIKSLYYLLGKKDLRINPFIWRLLKPISWVLAKFKKTSIMTIYAKKSNE